jgi:precorrin-6B methylase 2
MAIEKAPKSPQWKAELLFHIRAGPWKTFRWIADRLLDKQFDRRFGIESSQRGETKGYPPDAEQHQPISYTDMRQLLSRLTIRPEDVFLDYGAGMGRAVCLAATYRFKAVLGVEVSPELCRVAIRNLERGRPNFRCKDVRIVNANAVEYLVPTNVSVIFFFNPFGSETMEAVLDKIEDSLRQSRRNLRVIFYGTLSDTSFRGQAEKRDWLALESETVLKTGARVLHYVNHG